MRIIIEFFPQKTTSYYERVFIVVRNHQILYVDLVGTCFDVLSKPMPLMQRHVDIYRHKVIMGIHNRIRRDKEGNYFKDDMMSSNDNQSHHFSSLDMEINQEIPIDNPSQVVLHKEMFQDVCSQKRDIQLGEDFLDFNFTTVGRISESRALNIKNKFPYSIDVNWALLKVYNKVSEKWCTNPFKIRPEVKTIGANDSFDFMADFCPYEPDQYFF